MGKKPIVTPIPPVFIDVPAPSAPTQNVQYCPRCGAEMQEGNDGDYHCFSLRCAEVHRAREKALNKRVSLKIEGVGRFLWAA